MRSSLETGTVLDGALIALMVVWVCDDGTGKM
jgi:hypothetical protein